MKKIYTILLNLLANAFVFAQALSGTYYIGGPGTKPGNLDPEFATLSSAVTNLNINGVSGPCIFYFTESKVYTDTAVSLGCNGTSSTNTIIFKPYSGVNATLNFTSKFAKNIDGMFVIGSPNNLNTNLVSTNYITIDGSNIENGNTKNLIIQNPDTAIQRSVFRIFGNNNNITIKNCIINNRSTSSSSTSPINVSNYNVSSTNYTPDNIIIDNNTLNSNNGNGGLGLYLSNSGTPTTTMTGIIISNNLINFRGTKGIFINYVNDAEIFSNIISGDVQLADGSAAGIWLSTGGSTSGNFNIYNNKILQLKTWNNTNGASNGIMGIDNTLASPKIVNIYNNFIQGFITIPSASNCKIYGIRHTASSTSFIYNNTIIMPELTDMTNFGLSLIAGISFSTANSTETSPTGKIYIKNNIIKINESTMKVWGIKRVGTSGTFNSDYNNVYSNDAYVSAYTGFWNASDQKLLIDWKTASSGDVNSIYKNVEFVSATDLHLSGSSIGDYDLCGTPLSLVTTDIDGQNRSQIPYMGADENLELSLYKNSPRTVSMISSYDNSTVFSSNGAIGADQWTSYFAHWDNNYLYLGWNGGKTNYSSDMYYAAIDIDPDGNNGCVNPIEGVSFKDGGPKPDFYVVYENNSSFYGAPASNGNAVEIYNGSSGTWNWVSRTDGNDNTSSKVVFSDNAGEVRLRIPWSTLGITPGASTKLGLVMWNNNGSGNWLWGRVPLQNPSHGSSVILDYQFIYNSTGAGVNPSIDMISTPLPVELTSFNASAKGNIVQLNWKTATEKDNYGFDVERSINNVWEKVGFVQGNGNSNSVKEYSFVDNSVKEGKYSYRLKQVDNTGKYTYSNVVEVELSIPNEYGLTQNYPNPFNPSTTISYKLPMQSKVQLNVYSISGELVASLVNEEQSAGSYNINFDASKLATGTYIYRLIANDFIMTKKMLLIK